MNQFFSSAESQADSVREAVDSMLSRRVEADEPLEGFRTVGVSSSGMICNDCGDGDCECTS